MYQYNVILSIQQCQIEANNFFLVVGERETMLEKRKLDDKRSIKANL